MIPSLFVIFFIPFALPSHQHVVFFISFSFFRCSRSLLVPSHCMTAPFPPYQKPCSESAYDCLACLKDGSTFCNSNGFDGILSVFCVGGWHFPQASAASDGRFIVVDFFSWELEGKHKPMIPRKKRRAQLKLGLSGYEI